MSSNIYDELLNENYSAIIDYLRTHPKKKSGGICILYGPSKQVEKDTPSCDIIKQIIGRTSVKKCGECPYFIPQEILNLIYNDPENPEIITFFTNMAEKLKRL